MVTAIRERDEYIKELEQIKFKYEFGKHFNEIHSFLFELDFWEITELIGEEFDRKISFKSKNGCFVLNCKLVSRNYLSEYLNYDGYDKAWERLYNHLAKWLNLDICY